MVVLTNDERAYGTPVLVRKCMRCKQARWQGEFKNIYTKRCDICVEEVRQGKCRSCGGPAGLTAREEARVYCEKPECLRACELHSAAMSARVRVRRARAAKTKVCPVCGLRKPRTHEYFVPKRRDPKTGEIEAFHAWCRPCVNAVRRDRYATDLEFRRQFAKRDEKRRARVRQRRAVDPEYDRRYREHRAELSRVYVAKRKQGESQPLGSPSIVGRELPGPPLAAAIDAWIAKEGIDDHTAGERIGVADRRFREWRIGGKTRMSIADKCLVEMELLWWEVWPPDEFPEAVEIWEAP